MCNIRSFNCSCGVYAMVCKVTIIFKLIHSLFYLHLLDELHPPQERVSACCSIFVFSIADAIEFRMQCTYVFMRASICAPCAVPRVDSPGTSKKE